MGRRPIKTFKKGDYIDPKTLSHSELIDVIKEQADLASEAFWEGRNEWAAYHASVMQKFLDEFKLTAINSSI